MWLRRLGRKLSDYAIRAIDPDQFDEPRDEFAETDLHALCLKHRLQILQYRQCPLYALGLGNRALILSQ
jgi:hypothetical protein